MSADISMGTAQPAKRRFDLFVMILLLCSPSFAFAQITIPPQTPIEIRLTERISTQLSKQGSAVHAILAAPVMVGDFILIPIGSRAEGRVVHVNGVHLGLAHETSSIGVQIDSIILPDSTKLSLRAKVAQIEDSREVIDKRGRIAGVRSTSTLSHRASGVVGALSFSNPVALIFTTAASASLLRFSDPEINLPANTELVLLTTEALTVKSTSALMPAVADSEASKEALLHLTRRQPFRTATSPGHVLSDLTNLMFIGNGEAIMRAFRAAGWLQVDSLDATSTYKTIRSISEQQGYRTAPMSTLLLEDRRPSYSLAKTLDTFSKRHHVRVFATADRWEGKPVWLSSSTQDIGIGFSTSQKGFIHQIDHNIDHERTKIVNDLLLTGCVSGLNLVPRTWLPKGVRNGTGEEIITDNRMAVIDFDECHTPLNVPSPQQTVDLPLHQNGILKIVRQTDPTLRNMVLRDNIAVTGVAGVKLALGLKHPKPTEQPLAMSSILSASKYAVDLNALPSPDSPELNLRSGPSDISGTIASPNQPPQRRFTPYSIELGLHGGFAGFAGGNGGAVGYLFIPDDMVKNSLLLVALGNEHSDGWNLGASVTLNTINHLSHEISFDYNRTGFRLEFAHLDLASGSNATDPATQQDFLFADAVLSTTEVAYNLRYDLRSRQPRWRPYLSVGPSLRLTHLTEAPITRASPWFKLGLGTVGALTAAYNFGTTPPLEGGGIFQVGIQYGGGVKYRVSRRFLVRADYKETLTAQPDFWSKSKDDIFDPSELPGYRFDVIGPVLEGKMRQQRATMGVSFIF